MAYANLVNVACADKYEMFKRFRDFLCKRNGSYDYSTDGIGWTLHDAVYATDEDTIVNGDYFVIYSPGENGKEDMYYKILCFSSYYHVSNYLYWDNTTHVGTSLASSSVYNCYCLDNVVPTMWVYGDLDFVNLLFTPSADYTGNLHTASLGKPIPIMFSEEIAVTSSSYSAGSDVVITVDSVPSTWEVGQNIFIRDQANVEIISITALTTTTITTTLVAAYSSNAKLSASFAYTHRKDTYFLGTTAGQITHSGSLRAVLGYWAWNSTLVSYFSIGYLNGETGVVPITFGTSSAVYGTLKNAYVYRSGAFDEYGVYTLSDGTVVRAFKLNGPSNGARYVAFKEV